MTFYKSKTCGHAQHGGLQPIGLHHGVTASGPRTKHGYKHDPSRPIAWPSSPALYVPND
jgi:hypothetical protein